jgi:hypothetical protein
MKMSHHIVLLEGEKSFFEEAQRKVLDFAIFIYRNDLLY